MFARHRATHETAPDFCQSSEDAASATPAFPTVNGAEASSPAPSPVPQGSTPSLAPQIVPPVAAPAWEPQHLAPLPRPAAAGQVIGQVLPIHFVGDESYSMRASRLPRSIRDWWILAMRWPSTR